MMRFGGGLIRRWCSAVTGEAGKTGNPAKGKLSLKGFNVEKGSIVVHFRDPKHHYISSAFTFQWLFDNSPFMRTSSNQRIFRNVADLIKITPKHTEIKINDKGQQVLAIQWKNLPESWQTFPGSGDTVKHEGNQELVSELTVEFLGKFAHSKHIAKEKEKLLDPTNAKVELKQIKFQDIFPNGPENDVREEGVWDFLRKINDYGLCLVTDVPEKSGTVLELCKTIGEPSHKIYGESFDVVSEANPINIAYTNQPLEFHQDLAYFENPPGIQFLHARKFPREIIGGESLFIDCHAVATVMKQRFPKEFDSLCRLPGTFQKVNFNRGSKLGPLMMYYSRPHISVNENKSVISVLWSPPFEGPVTLEALDCSKYYAAYGKFQGLLNSNEMMERYGLKFRLKEGETVVFNNRRLLHGRNGFSLPTNESGSTDNSNGRRELQGCYADIDTFLNKYRLLNLKYNALANETELFLGNAVHNENRFGIPNYR